METVILSSDVRHDIDLIIEIAEKFGIKSFRKQSIGESYETESDSEMINISDIATHLKNNDFVGIWSDRADIFDSSKYVRNLRTNEFVK